MYQFFEKIDTNLIEILGSGLKCMLLSNYKITVVDITLKGSYVRNNHPSKMSPL